MNVFAEAMFVLVCYIVGKLLLSKGEQSNSFLSLPLAFFLGVTVVSLGPVVCLILGTPMSFLWISFSTISIAIFLFFLLGNRVTPNLSILNSGILFEFMALLVGVATFCYINLTFLSWDSYFMNVYGSNLYFDRLPGKYVGSALSSYPIFSVVPNLYAEMLQVDFFVSYYPLLGALVSIFLFGVGVEISLNSFRNKDKLAYISSYILAIVPVIFLNSIYFWVFQSFYLNGHIEVAAFILLSCYLLRAPDKFSGEVGFKVGVVFLMSLCMTRIEGALYAAAILYFLGIGKLFFLKHIKFLLLILTAVTAWYTKLMYLNDSSEIGSPSRLIGLLLILAISIGSLNANRFAFIREKAARIVGLSILIILSTCLIAYYMFESHLGVSVLNLYQNLTSNLWGWVFYSIIGLVACSLIFLKRCSDLRVLGVLCAVVGAILILSVFRAPYRIGWGDSGNRMLIHVLPLFIMYFVSVFHGGAIREDA